VDSVEVSMAYGMAWDIYTSYEGDFPSNSTRVKFKIVNTRTNIDNILKRYITVSWCTIALVVQYLVCLESRDLRYYSLLLVD
jgi:hypothetical protein